MGAGAETPADLERHKADTVKIYDSLPYISRPIFRSHPARMAAVAKLFGLVPVPPAKARVLELGCAAGGNLIPLAARYPEARFLGIDLGGRMIEDGQRRVAALGAKTIELRVESITDFAESNGKFDYIIAHGVYSWVPEPVREAILAICERQLSPNGVVYISYNVLPGWRTYQPLRDAMRIVSDSAGETAQAQQGAALLAFLEQATPDEGIWRDMIRRARRMIDGNLTYLFHEYLEPVNEPCMFLDFANAADRHGLAYLGETELPVMYPQAHGGDFATKVGSVSDGIIQQQQMLDLLTGTAFRHSLLIRKSQAGRLDRGKAMARLASLYVTASAFHRYERVSADQVKLHAGDDKEQSFDDPVTVVLLDRLFGSVPCSLSFAQWVGGIDADDQALSAIVSEWIMTGVVALVSDPLCAATVSERPLADALARADAALGRSETSNVLHAGVALSDAFKLLLPLLDGTRTQDQLAGLVVASVLEGKAAWPKSDAGKVPQDDLAEWAGQMVSTNLEAMAEFGLLIA